MTEKIDIKEACLAVRGKFEDNGDPSWDDMCALVLETVCFAAETFADGTWDDLGEMLEEAVAFDESGENSLARIVFGNGFLDTLAARFRQSGKRTADASDFCLPEHQGLVHPLARAVELDESSMVDHPVDHRGGKLVVAQDRSPFAELDVGGEHHASLLVAC